MSNKGHRSGGKFGGSHTSMIPLAEVLVDSIVKYSYVSKISAGYIKAGLSPSNGNRQVKVYDAKGGIRLRVRDNTSRQDILVCTGNALETKRILCETATDKRVNFRLGENADE
ncbi:MAG: hypothetical protein COZ27_00610 [Candidatus Moranbacteria bacterium CG_4_10_14_3_um_filter_41_65]|nr:MAG: hypothetical protein AUK58_03515 [Candidatus Moranbacteria bacterium CG2_30_41_165]PIP25810.1 MAG: hypothetical protein COX32_01415 [Candidatus Moranbacteria bacterium CG23_combo_of_CG06-09_8_20_14_all_41_28]PIV86220.1 MAG: hypothetical protein COW50_02690 [Candidatus Moranbacteria bacterium CG17_big_fil_post_rev_8_21_14_2_50_41_107]PIW94007.1 MAG: hypothetical protein COZ86_03310 [Candidatus Moranbacteria bacterium CG_4_8_14_3_um_filter_41_13]PIX91849.1 MAG: hypothetical protein COZ27_